MPISGVILTLDPDAKEKVNVTIELLRGRPELTVGQRVGPKLPLAMDTDSSLSHEGLVEWLQQLPGVLHVDVTFVAFDEEQTVRQSDLTEE